MSDPDSSPTRILSRDGRAVARQVGRFRVALADGSVAAEGAVRPVRVGSREGNDLRIDDPTVSRFHLEIEATPEGYLLRDLGSTNGTELEGLRVREAFLPPRARLRAGAVSLRFELLGTDEEAPLHESDCFGRVLGRSPAMRELYTTLERVAPRDLTVLIEGESGTGKEMVAEAVHERSSRAEQPFVVFDCAAVASSLIESELFGHERGAFTGAVSRRLGRFEEARGGTLFLDEIGELPLDLQPKLLRALERREIRRVGGTGVSPVDVRVLAATNRDLAREVNRGSFRADLYYRLAVVRVVLPPLRERREDIPVLVEQFVRQSFSRGSADAESGLAAQEAALRGISPEVWRALLDHPWPGNVRELRNFIERSLALGDAVQPPSVAGGTASPAGAPPSVALDRPFVAARDELLAAFERAYLQAALDAADGNLSAAARRAGLDRMYFKRLCRKHGVAAHSDA